MKSDPGFLTPAEPPGALGRSTVEAAVLVDRFAVQLLAACGPFDPEAERLARVRGALAAWREVEDAVQELARVAGVDLVDLRLGFLTASDLAAANDQAAQELAA